MDKETQSNALKKKELHIIEDLYDTLEDAYIERYKDFMKNPTSQQLQFARDMISLITNDVDTNYLTVIPARCGISKSIFIQSLISYFTRYDSYDYRSKESIGIVIVTDMLKRLEKYQESPKNPQSIWCVDNFYKVKHDKFCTYISSSNSKKTALDLLIESRYRPVVLLSTQRYFSMPDEQREMLFEYQIGRGDKKQLFKREIIIFDEKPEFSSSKIINVKNFNLVAAALQDGIPKSDVNKDWILQEYRAFRNKMEIILREKEKEKITKPTDRFYWRDVNSHNMTTDDNRFFELISKHRKKICKEYQDAFTDLRDFKQLMKEGAFFITVSTHNNENQDYKTYFQLYQDNSYKFYLGKNKVKTFIFDATADIDPDYQLDYVKMIDCSQFNIDIDLTIKHIDIGTSKTQIVIGRNKDSIISAIKKSILDYVRNSFGGMVAVTYQNTENSFNDKSISACHFGGIKGLNNYSKYSNMAHVGLNRLSDFDYFIKFIALKPEILINLKKMDENKSRSYIEQTIALKKGLFTNERLHSIMNKSLLTDFEQNIFRIKIRDFSNTTHAEVFTYWNCEMFADLNKMIFDRYSPYGVQVENIGVPIAINKMKTETRKSKDGEGTTPQRIIKWYNAQPVGRLVKTSDIVAEIKIDYAQFKRALQTNKTVKALFEKSKADKKGYYKIVA